MSISISNRLAMSRWRYRNLHNRDASSSSDSGWRGFINELLSAVTLFIGSDRVSIKPQPGLYEEHLEAHEAFDDEGTRQLKEKLERFEKQIK